MRCCDARAWMSAYFDSELDAGTTFKVACHLECCEACRERFGAESSADASIAGELCREEMPEALWTELRSSVMGRGRRVHRGWLAFAATIVAVGVLAILTDEDSVSKSGRFTEEPVDAAEGVLRDFMRTARADGTWVDADVDEEGAPWVEVGGASAGTRLALLEGTSFDLADADVGHGARLVSIRRREVDGQEVMEVRLVCCGEPVLLRVARAPADAPNVESDGGITRPSVGRPVITGKGMAGAGDLHVASRRFGEWVAIGASCHSIDHVLLALRPT